MEYCSATVCKLLLPDISYKDIELGLTIGNRYSVHTLSLKFIFMLFYCAFKGASRFYETLTLYFISSQIFERNLTILNISMQYVHFLQRKYSLSSFNLLGHTAPAQAGTLLILGPFLDYWLTTKRIDQYNFTFPSMVSIYSVCLLSILLCAQHSP